MKRRLFNLLAIVSVMLCIATAACWIRSYHIGSYESVSWAQRFFKSDYAMLSPGSFDLTYTDSHPNRPASWFQRIAIGMGPLQISQCELVMEGDGLQVGTPERDTDITVRLWFLLLSLAVLPAVWGVGWIRAMRERLGMCANCGYDLRATPDRCPECGTVATSRTADWIDANQLGRRNLKPDQMSLLRGRRYNRTKKASHRPKGHQNDGLNGKTADRLAKQHGVSKPTIERDGAFAAGDE